MPLSDASSPSSIPSPDQVYQLAAAHHQAGRLQEAERLYRLVLQAQPHHADANYRLGKLAIHARQPVAAASLFKSALENDPSKRHYWLDYIDALILADRPDLAQQGLTMGRQHGLQGPDVEALVQRLAGKPAPQAKPAKPSKAAKPAKKPGRHRSAAPSPQELNNLMALFNQGLKQERHGEAEAYARTLTERYPQHGLGWKVLGATLMLQNRNEEALPPLQKAVSLLPGDAELLLHLGNLFNVLGQQAAAEASYCRTIAVKPNLAAAHHNLGVIYKDQERLAESEACFRRALEINPNYVEAYSNLANTLKSQGRIAEAEGSYRQALEINPHSVEAWNNLGNLLKDLRRLQEAEACFRRALEIDPNSPQVYSNLGVVLNDQSRLDESEACYHRALELRPDYADAHSNLLFAMNYSASHAPAYRYELACRYGRMVGGKVKARYSNWQCAARPERLRVGLVSGDFSSHPVGYFLEGLLSHVDRAKVELVAYPTNLRVDRLTNRIKPYFVDWKPLQGLTDEMAARLIHNDGVHILIDLSGHSAQNRLPVFAWKPAPVQVTWLGYFATTGLTEIDYLLADEVGVPATQHDQFSEKIWYLPDTRLCFSVPEVDLPVAPLPAVDSGQVTFGCFQSLSKVGDDVLAVWSQVMAAVPNARLRMQCRQLGDDTVHESFLQRMQRQGIDRNRVVTHGLVPRDAYMASHAEVDFILDTFPYPGGTTTCEALWMGVPTLTLAGDNLIARQGASLLTAAGLGDWVTETNEEYVDKAVRFASDIPALARLRAGLRSQVLASPVFDAALFARRLETALWEMWSRYQGA